MNKIYGILAIVFVAGVASAALIVKTASYVPNAANDNSMLTLGTGVSASAGDVIVLAVAGSKSYVHNWSILSSGGGAVAAAVENWNDKNAAVVYYKVTASGSFDIKLDRANSTLSYDTAGLYVIGSDVVGRSVDLAGSAQKYIASNVSVNNTLDYGTLAGSGILIEAAAVSGFSSYPSYTANINPGNSRGTFLGTFSAGSVLSAYVTTDITKNSRTVGYAFNEVIPEPATVGMLGIGALITLLARRFSARR